MLADCVKLSNNVPTGEGFSPLINGNDSRGLNYLVRPQNSTVNRENWNQTSDIRNYDLLLNTNNSNDIQLTNQTSIKPLNNGRIEPRVSNVTATFTVNRSLDTATGLRDQQTTFNQLSDIYKKIYGQYDTRTE